MSEVRACYCMGPQNGQPLCPCRMRGVTVQNGRYVEVIDHGPAHNWMTEDEFKLALDQWAGKVTGAELVTPVPSPTDNTTKEG